MASFNVISTEMPIWIDSKEAGGTIAEGAVVKYSTDADVVVVCTAETDFPFGIARHAASSGDRVSVIRAGRANVLLLATGGATMGNPVIVNGSAGHTINWTNETGYAVGTYDTTRTAGTPAELVPMTIGVYRIKT
jgi:hypothetical protein